MVVLFGASQNLDSSTKVSLLQISFGGHSKLGQSGYGRICGPHSDATEALNTQGKNRCCKFLLSVANTLSHLSLTIPTKVIIAKSAMHVVASAILFDGYEAIHTELHVLLV